MPLTLEMITCTWTLGMVHIVLWLFDVTVAGVFFRLLYTTLRGALEPSDNVTKGNTHDTQTFISIKNPFSYFSTIFMNQAQQVNTPKSKWRQAPLAMNRPPPRRAMSLNEAPIRGDWALGCAVTLREFEVYWMLSSYSKLYTALEGIQLADNREQPQRENVQK